MIYVLGENGSGKSQIAAAITAMKGSPRWYSTSRVLSEYVSAWSEKDLDEWWSQRRDNRAEWVEEFARLRSHDLLAHIRLVHRSGLDIFDGERRFEVIRMALRLPKVNPIRPSHFVLVYRPGRICGTEGIDFTLFQVQREAQRWDVPVSYVQSLDLSL